MPKRGPRYTPEEAESRIPVVVKNIALEAIDLMITLDSRSIGSHEVERRVWSLTGQVGYLSRLCHLIWKFEGLKKGAAPPTD